MRIAVEGCAHGELDIIYETVQEMEKADGKKIDLLICCGDFQSTRNLSDLSCMAVPDKYKDMCTFYKYYSGEKTAPVLTIFIGGNHEASNYLQELPYGGWVAPNIYYMGYAGVVTIGGVRIAGLSGIYKSQHWLSGRYERPPYTDSTIRSIYHIRNIDVFRLKQLTGQIDVFLSHDWPAGVTKYGDENVLLKNKPFFKSDIQNNKLGSPPSMALLAHHYPSYWFSAHLHCKFAALVPEKGGNRVTKFLALDKCLPRRKFLQILELPHDQSIPLDLHYDLEWLTILYLTNHLLSVKSGIHSLPVQTENDKWIYSATTEHKEKVLNKFNGELKIPLNFAQTAKPYSPDDSSSEPVQLLINQQTTQFCNTLGIDDPSVLLKMRPNNRESRGNELDASYDSIPDTNEVSASEDEIRLNSTCEGPANSSPKSNSDELEAESGNSCKEDSLIIDDSNGHCVEIEPNCKKFKRRNHSIYSNTL